jgi:hypothetical protein
MYDLEFDGHSTTNQADLSHPDLHVAQDIIPQIKLLVVFDRCPAYTSLLGCHRELHTPTSHPHCYLPYILDSTSHQHSYPIHVSI